ncbi:hypothetical protein B7729_02390 [Streptococcus oralis subsp. tigurinus]|uniref:Uncharacterized protein n=2 Tax=Streptococcus oralis TaxID=1303 RepID=A0A1X1G098_STROR|nr:hypothetical protein B7729_02390 [Streptococcus oralis subsp. tigurinus]
MATLAAYGLPKRKED